MNRPQNLRRTQSSFPPTGSHRFTTTLYDSFHASKERAWPLTAERSLFSLSLYCLLNLPDFLCSSYFSYRNFSDKLQTITPQDFRNLAADFHVNLPEKFLYEK